MKKIGAFFIVMILAGIIGFSFLDTATCKNHHDIELTKLLKEKYTQSGLFSYININNELCHIEDYKIDTKPLNREVNSFYRGAAARVQTAKEKEILLKWLESEKLPHQFTKINKGYFVVVYSKNETELVKNKNKLYEVLRNAKKAL